MRLILIGCEYVGTTTLANKIANDTVQPDDLEALLRLPAV